MIAAEYPLVVDAKRQTIESAALPIHEVTPPLAWFVRIAKPDFFLVENELKLLQKINP